MNLREIKKLIPDNFKYLNKNFIMIHYSKKATHKNQISDNIIWQSDSKKYIIEYDKGKISFIDDVKGEVLREYK